MAMKQNFSLKEFNTFGIRAVAKHFVEIHADDDLFPIVESGMLRENSFLILGGGSNILLPEFYDGVVLRNCIQGIDVIQDDDDAMVFLVGAGENWNDFVDYSVDLGLHGIEALALIPGTVGACPVQNIGAYGLEAASSIVEVNCVDLDTGHRLVFANAQCAFSYRDSMFKDGFNGNLFITSVKFKLRKYVDAFFVSEEVRKELRLDIDMIAPRHVRDAVIQIRQRKLPDPRLVGNAGSIFKNPFVSTANCARLKTKHPQMPSYRMPDELFKVPAGWLIEQAGWKGWISENRHFGVYQQHALIIVNYGDSTAAELTALIKAIRHSVLVKFGVQLEEEVVLL
jgi:UDP-N-acetylmuramate dehydrogenase